MAQVVRRTVRRVVLRKELWNGNREPWSNLWSPATSVVAWSWTQHAAIRQRYETAMSDPNWSHLRFVRIGSKRDIKQLLSDLSNDVSQSSGKVFEIQLSLEWAGRVDDIRHLAAL